MRAAVLAHHAGLWRVEATAAAAHEAQHAKQMAEAHRIWAGAKAREAVEAEAKASSHLSRIVETVSARHAAAARVQREFRHRGARQVSSTDTPLALHWRSTDTQLTLN
jgi:hypothetical protein